MNDSMLRVIAMTNLPQPYYPTPERTAANNALDAFQRSSLPVEHPAHLSAEVAAVALAAFVALCPPPVPDYSHCASASDVRVSQALRAPVMAQSVSYAVTYLAQREGLSVAEAEAVLAHLKPYDGHRPNTLLARRTLNRYATEKGIRFQDAEAVLRE